MPKEIASGYLSPCWCSCPRGGSIPPVAAGKGFGCTFFSFAHAVPNASTHLIPLCTFSHGCPRLRILSRLLCSLIPSDPMNPACPILLGPICPRHTPDPIYPIYRTFPRILPCVSFWILSVLSISLSYYYVQSTYEFCTIYFCDAMYPIYLMYP